MNIKTLIVQFKDQKASQCVNFAIPMSVT